MGDSSAAATVDKRPAHPSIVPILIAAALGILTGLFFGDGARIFQPVGQAYLMLLEVAVYPYLLASLLHGLSSMSPATALRLLRAGWPFYLFIWTITFVFLWILSLSFPQPLPSTLEVGTQATISSQQMLQLFIPSDFFAALSTNSVPAVVLFCIVFGVAFQQVKDKDALLSILDGIRQASLVFWKFVVRLMPYAVFALMADSAGTFRLSSLDYIGIYMFLFVFGVLVIVFWLIPGCLSAFTPWNYREIMSQLGSALMVSFVTTLPVTGLPYVIEATRQLAKKCEVDDPACDEVIRTHISVAYPLAQLGNYFVYLFILFTAFFMNKAIPASDQLLLPVLTLLSCCGTPASSVNALSFMSNSFHLPSGGVDLYVELMTITRYAQVVASVMGYASLSFLVILAYYGKLKFRWLRLAGVLASTALAAILVATIVHGIITRAIEHTPNPYLTYSLDPALTKKVKVSYASAGEFVPLEPKETVTERIQRTGVLRVGYNAGAVPFCFRNGKGDLAGYDVAMAYEFAEHLNVKLRFVPSSGKTSMRHVKAGAFDIAMSGIYLTRERLIHLGVTNPYYQSPLAFFTTRDKAQNFLSRDQMAAQPGLRLGAYTGSILLPILQKTFPEAMIVSEQAYSTLPDFSKIDGAMWSLTEGDALAAANPRLIAVPTQNLGNPVLFVYLVPPGSEDFLKTVNFWLLQNHDSGFEKLESAYWIDRQPRPGTKPRWSILRQLTGQE